MSILFTALFLLLTAASAYSQAPNVRGRYNGLSTDGRDFYVAYVPGVLDCPLVESNTGASLLINSVLDNEVTVSYLSGSGVETSIERYPMAAMSGLQVRLKKELLMLNLAGEIAEYKTCHITSRKSISVQYQSSGPAAGGLMQVIPVHSLGKHYVVTTLPSNPRKGAGTYNVCGDRASNSLFYIIGTTDSTRVTIIPNGLTTGGKVGVTTGVGATGVKHPFTITLHRGQVYFVRGDTDEAVDMSGSNVESSAPVMVVGGNDGAFITYNKTYAGTFEDRDLTIEQMVPVEFWKDSDLVSIPQFDSPPSHGSDPGYGEHYAIATSSEESINVDFISSTLGKQTEPVAQYTGSRIDFKGVDGGVNATAKDSGVIYLTAFQDRQVSASPSSVLVSGPAQMGVVPYLNWKSRYQFVINDPPGTSGNSHYISVLMRMDNASKILLYKLPASTPVPLSSLTAMKTYQVPGVSGSIVGKRYKLVAGSYALAADEPFCCYSFGTDIVAGGTGNDNVIGLNDWFTSYASSCGQQFQIEGALPPKVTSEKDCQGLKFEAGDAVHGIANVELIESPLQTPLVTTFSTNVELVTSYTPGDKQVEGQIRVVDLLKPAYAALAITNKAGKDTLLTFSYTPPSVSFSSLSAGFEARDTCGKYWLKNSQTSPFRVNAIRLKRGDPGLTIQGPSTPLDIAPGDSIYIDLCFHAIDGVLHRDTLLFESTCLFGLLPVAAGVERPIIESGDVAFGESQAKRTVCRSVRVMNGGRLPLKLTSGKYSGSPEFVFADSTKLPMTVAASASVDLTFCYTPTGPGLDSGRFEFATNQTENAHELKDFVVLTGTGVIPLLKWSVDTLVMARDTVVNLMNVSKLAILVDSVSIVGPDASEFSLPGGARVVFYLGGEQSIPYRVHFEPDLTKPDSVRKAWIAVYDRTGWRPLLPVFASSGALGVGEALTAREARVSVHPQPASDGVLTVSVDAETSDVRILSVTLCDLLGVERVRMEGDQSSSMTIDVSRLVPGVYLLKVYLSGSQRVIRVVVD